MKSLSFAFAFLGVSGALAVQPQSPLADIGPAPAVKLTDAEGKPFDLEKLHGKCVLVSFVFTTCNGTCPLTSRAMARAVPPSSSITRATLMPPPPG